VPIWEFEVDGHRLTKRLAMPYGQNTVCVEYRLSSGGPIRLLLRPFLTFRMHDEALGLPPEWPFTLAITRGRYEVRPFEGAPPLRLGLRPQGGVFVADATVSQGVFYRVERDRGYDHRESQSTIPRMQPCGTSMHWIATIRRPATGSCWSSFTRCFAQSSSTMCAVRTSGSAWTPEMASS
jgi:Glycogen debranching enzyme N terminal